jgi:DNA-binding transcriptional MocR family regulator
LNRNIVTDTFIKNLSKSQISIDSIDKNYLSNFHKERLLKLNVSNVKEEKIEEGIGKVIEEIKRMNRVDFQFKKE